MKIVMFVLVTVILSGCGYSQRNVEAIGQVKRVKNITPLICPDYTSLDLSLGVMRNGVGSMSTEDIYLYVPEDKSGTVNAMLLSAAERGKLVKVIYDTKRLTLCVPERQIREVQILEK